MRWDNVVYQPGELKVVTYRQGRKWAAQVMKTAGTPAALGLRADRDRIRADGKDLSFVTVAVTDKAGWTAPRANPRIHFDIKGPG